MYPVVCVCYRTWGKGMAILTGGFVQDKLQHRASVDDAGRLRAVATASSASR